MSHYSDIYGDFDHDSFLATGPQLLEIVRQPADFMKALQEAAQVLRHRADHPDDLQYRKPLLHTATKLEKLQLALQETYLMRSAGADDC